MESATVALLIFDFGLIVSLPHIFFLPGGRLNLRWWLTTLPVAVCPAFVIGAQVARLPSLLSAHWLPWTGSVASLLFALSVGLIAMSLGSHDQPIAQWHQDDDDPEQLVTYGAYERIRHPFYTAFLLAFAGAVLAFPHVVTIALASYMTCMLTVLAIREERKLKQSAFSADYADYLDRAGRFLPKVST